MAKETKIDQLYAFVMVDEEYNIEGILGYKRDSVALSMVGADLEKVEQLRPLAKQIANTYGKPVKLLLFSERKEVEIILPEK